MAEESTREALTPGEAQLPAVRGFLVEAQLGRGAVGTTYRARVAASPGEPPVALKVLHPHVVVHPATHARIATLTAALGKAEHAQLARFRAFGQLPGSKVHFVVSELVAGGSLTESLGRDGTTVRQVVERFCELLSGLAEGHRHGLLHLGLRPTNVLIEQHESGPRVRICDLGLNRLLKRQAGEPPVLHLPEQLRYASPEQLRGGELDGRSDIFGVGALLYEALTGSSPFFRDSAPETIEAVCGGEPEPPTRRRPERRIPRELEAVCLRALRGDPGDRFRSPLEMSQALRASLELLATRADTPLGPSFSASPPAPPASLRMTLPGDHLPTRAKLFLGVALIAAATAVIYVVTSGKRVDRATPSSAVAPAP